MKLRLGPSEALSHWARYQANRPCISTEIGVLTYAQVNGLVDYLIEVRGFREVQNDCIALVAQDKLLLIACLLAAIRCGNYPSIMNPMLAAEVVCKEVEALKVTRVYVESALLNDAYRSMCVETLSIEDIRIGLAYRSTQMWPAPELSSIGLVLYSSGTTGPPKGIVRSHVSLITELLGWCIELNATRDSHFLICRPVYYTGGLVLALAALLVGGRVSLYQEWSPELYCSWVRDKVDMAFMVPSQIKELVAYVSRHGSPASKAQIVLSMGAPFPAPLKMDARKYLMSDIWESWGNTEGLGTIATQVDSEVRPESIGRPFLSDDLFIANAKGERCAPREVGHLAGYVDSGFSAYCQPNGGWESATPIGLVVSEDLGFVDDDGYFYLLGRDSDVINGRTGAIYPMVIEKVISDFPEVREVAVVGLDAGAAQVPVAYVLCEQESVDLENLRIRINSRLDGEQQLHGVVAVKEFPKTASGKIIKSRLGH